MVLEELPPLFSNNSSLNKNVFIVYFMIVTHFLNKHIQVLVKSIYYVSIFILKRINGF